MKKLMVVALVLLASNAWAEESCEVTKKVNGKLTFVTVPCSTMKTEHLVKDEEAAQKRKCGKDYGAIRLGMTIERLEECTGAVYVTETVTNGGVIETYRTSFDIVDVKDGKVVSYTKRRY